MPVQDITVFKQANVTLQVLTTRPLDPMTRCFVDCCMAQVMHLQDKSGRKFPAKVSMAIRWDQKFASYNPTGFQDRYLGRSLPFW